MHRARLIGGATLIAVALIAAWAQPASASPTVWQTMPWHGGRPMWDYYGGGLVASSGPTFYGGNGKWYKAETYHQHVGQYGFGTPKFGSVYNGGTDYYNGNSVLLPSAPYTSQYDIVLVELGANAPARSRSTYSYCNTGAPWNCSSPWGGGTANNPDWTGFWRTNVGYQTGNVTSATYCHSGIGAGESCGVGNTNVVYTAQHGWHWQVTNLGGCGATTGDSGGPVYLLDGAGNTYLAGMLFAVAYTATAGAGNSCYYQGRPYGTTLGFYNIDTIRVLFQAQTGDRKSVV